MNFKFIISFITFALIQYNCLSQTTYKSGGSTKYKILTDNPDNIKPVIIGFNALVADTWGTNSYMGIGAFVQVNVLKYGSVNIDWKKAYFDMVKGVKNHRGIEIGLAYNLFSFKTDKDMQVVLGSSLSFTQTRRTQYTSYISVPGTAKKIVQLRAGLNNFKTATDNQEVGGGFNFSLDSNYRVINWKSPLQYNFLYTGISWHTINNLVIQHSGNDLATNCNDYNFFFDVLYNPFNINLDNANGYVRLPNGGSQNMGIGEIALKPDNKIKNAGWRIGWEARKNNIMGAFTYKVEIGARPGLKNSKKGLLSANSYMLLSAGFTFPAGKKVKAIRETE